LFFGTWLIGTGFTLLFTQHKYNPFDASTSTVPLIGIPIGIGVYAAILTTVWAAVARFKFEFINELLFTGMMIVGGLFAPHMLSFIFGLLQ
jgi:hypothetical protein